MIGCFSGKPVYIIFQTPERAGSRGSGAIWVRYKYRRSEKHIMKLAIGIDLGGSKIAGALVDENGKVLDRYVRPTEPNKPKEDIVGNIIEVARLLNRKGVVAIGIGAPGFFDSEGRLIFVPNVKKLHKVNLKKEVSKGIRLPIYLANDATCFALAECRHGAAKGRKNVVGVVIGTGVGSGIVINGKAYHGAIGGAGEIGHTKIKTEDDGMIEFEKIISGTAFLKKYESLSGRSARSIAEISKSDDSFRKVYHKFVQYTGVLFANLVNTLNPEMIVVGGGLSNLDFYDDVERRMRKLAVSELGAACRVRKNRLGADAGAIGAALLALENL